MRPTCAGLGLREGGSHPAVCCPGKERRVLWLGPADAQSVLVGSAGLALWSVAEQKRVAKFMGHSVRPAAMRLLPCLHPAA